MLNHLVGSFLITLAVVSSVTARPDATGLQYPPPQPAAYPPSNELAYIPDSFLQDPLVTSAMDHVKKVVRPELLAVKPSIYINLQNVNYTDDKTKWNYGSITPQDTDDYWGDIYTCPTDNDWGLSYDDGPSLQMVNGQHVNDTGAIRDRLGKLNVKATFFVVGSSAILYPQELKASFDAGHEIAVHTWSHHPMTSMTNEQLVAEIKYTEALIYNITGKLPAYFRPPYGDRDDRTRSIVAALGYKSVIWGYDPPRDTGDTSADTEDVVVQRVEGWLTAAQPQRGIIALQHDLTVRTCGIATQILDWLINYKASGKQPTVNIKGIAQCLGTSAYRDISNGGAQPSPSASSGSSQPSQTGSASSTDKPKSNAAVGGSQGWGLLAGVAVVSGVVAWAAGMI